MLQGLLLGSCLLCEATSHALAFRKRVMEQRRSKPAAPIVATPGGSGRQPLTCVLLWAPQVPVTERLLQGHHGRAFLQA